MGAAFNKIEAYLVFTSEKHMRESFDSLDDDLKEISGMLSFANLNNTYLFLNESTSLPYSTCVLLEGYFSELVERSFWGQYFLESEELEMDVSYTKPMPKGLQTIEPHDNIENIPNFSSYFTPIAGWKKFAGKEESFRVNLQCTTIENEDCFYFEVKDDSNFLPTVLTEGLLQLEDNKVYIITHVAYRTKLLASKSFAAESYMKEVFANTDASLNRNSFILSEESGFYFNKCNGIVKEVNLNGTVLTNCLEIQHGYIHVNCYNWNEANQFYFENYICNDNQMFTYWELDKGLVGISGIENGIKKDFIGSESVAEEIPELPSPDSISTTPNPLPEKKESFFKRLFSRK